MPSSPDPAPHTLEVGVLHLYRARLDARPVQESDSASLLSPAEIERNARFHFERDRRRHRRSTTLLRRLLATIVDTAPERLVFVRGAHGKPALATGPSFNISHSGEWWLCGVALDGRVGVDVEVHRTLSDLPTLARETFHPAEAEAVLGHSLASARHEAFFRVWSRKEAFIKAVGQGLAYPLDGFVVSAEERPARLLLDLSDPTDGAQRWQMESVSWEPGLAAAVAWDRPGGRHIWCRFPWSTA